MTRPVIYMCHPVAGDVKNNIARALRWLAWLRKSYPKTTFIAPWIAGVMSVGSDGTPEERKAGLVDDCAEDPELAALWDEAKRAVEERDPDCCRGDRSRCRCAAKQLAVRDENTDRSWIKYLALCTATDSDGDR